MEYIYTALLLHAAGKKIDEKSVTDVLKAAGVEVDEARVKALVASLEDVDIDEAISQSVAMPVQASSAPAEGASVAEEKKEEKKEEEEEEVSEEEAAAGLGALFG